MSEFTETIRKAVRVLAANDLALRRFGAAAHRYELLPPLARADLDAFDLPLPDDLREFAMDVSSGGAGPGYGVLPFSPANVRGGWLALADLGCGYVAALGPDGRVWYDARAVGILAPAFPTFTAWYIDWIRQLEAREWPHGVDVPRGCNVAHALTDYIARTGDDAFVGLGADAIVLRAPAGLALFAEGEILAPCVACARTLEGLGIPPSVVARPVR